MKYIKFLLTSGLFALLSLFTNITIAQSDVYFQINHKLDTEIFDFESTSVNNLGEEFNFTRLEYYLSSITLVHDGGIETLVPDTWILVDAGTFTNVYLGNFDVTNLESISFGVGVEEEVNHLDPTTYPSDHPLAPQAPAMQWGWAAGYRFVAMEGNAGTDLSQVFQIHALGDVNYRIDEVTTSGIWDEGVLYIGIDADYTKAMMDISLEDGLINHGETGEAATLLLNFNKDVFKEGDVTISTGINDVLSFADFWMAPNPAVNTVTIKVADRYLNNAFIVITDMMGKTILRNTANTFLQIDINNIPTGLYHVNLEINNKIVSTKKLYINNK